MSVNPSAAPAGAAQHPIPTFGQGAMAILGSMILLIVALMALLIWTTHAEATDATSSAPGSVVLQ